MTRRSKRMVYLAAPLFSLVERRLNSEVAEALGKVFDVYLPQSDGGLMCEQIDAGISAEKAAQCVFAADIRALSECDLILAVLDGRALDEGVAFELGFGFARGCECYGLQTDVRRPLPSGNNPMIEQALKCTFHSLLELKQWLHTLSQRADAIALDDSERLRAAEHPQCEPTAALGNCVEAEVSATPERTCR